MARRTRRRHPRSNDPQFSDEYLTALTRGFYIPLSGDTGPQRRETYEPGDTFEETYPKYPFSTLVRIALKLAEWLSRPRATLGQRDRPERLKRVL